MGAGQAIVIPPGFQKDNPDIVKSLKSDQRKKMSMSVMTPAPPQKRPQGNKNEESLDKSFNGGLPYQENSRKMYQSFNPPQADQSYSAAGYSTAQVSAYSTAQVSGYQTAQVSANNSMQVQQQPDEKATEI